MICEKCKIEFHEGRECPNCGTLAIFVKDDEYLNRRQEWEEENAPEEEEVKSKKLNIKLNIDYKQVKKVSLIVVAVAVLVIVVAGILWGILGFISQEKFQLVYDEGKVLGTGNKNYASYSIEEAIFTTDGNYVYRNQMNVNGVEGEIQSQYVDSSGKYCGVVSMEGDDIDAMTYRLYALENRDDVKGSDAILVTMGSSELRIAMITSDGAIYYEEAFVGTFNTIESMNLYCYRNGVKQLLAEDIVGFIPGDNDDEIIYYNHDYEGFIYRNGRSTMIDTKGASQGNDYACVGDTIYYVTGSGELYRIGQVGSIDRGVVPGSLSNVVNSDKVTYIRDGSLYAVGGQWKTPVQLIAEYDQYGKKGAVLERHGILYFVEDGRLYTCNGSGKKKLKKEEVQAVYFTVE